MTDAFPSRRFGVTLGSLLAFLLSGLEGHATPAGVARDSTRRLYPFYVGLQAISFQFSGFGQSDKDGSMLSYRGLMPVVGYRFAPRWRVEAGGLWRTPADGEITQVNYPDGSIYRFYTSYEKWVVPVVTRFSLLPRARRWGVEGIMGVSFLHTLSEGHASNTPANQPLQPFYTSGSSEANDLPILLGLGLTYSPLPHWTLSAEGRMNWSWLGSLVTAALVGRTIQPQPGVSAGVRYNFACKIPRKK